MKFSFTCLMKIKCFILILFFLSKAAFAQQDNSKPFVLGVIDEIQSTVLAEKRILNIYLPEGYNKADTTRYPVVYLLDGSADEDFIHVSGLFQFNSFPWINRVPKSIIVGIANVDRKRDFTYPTTVETDRKKLPTTGHSAEFISFLETELQPFIEKNYRTNTSKMLIGQSLAGLLAAEVLIKKPALFNKYIIISPSLWWDKGSLLKQSSDILEAKYSHRTDIYIGVGKEGLVSPVAAPGDAPHVMEVDANVFADQLKRGKSKSVHVYFDYLPEENHGTITHQAVFNALKLLYPLPEADHE